MTSSQKVLSYGKIIFTIIYLMIWPALIFFLSGNWRWAEGWIFSIWFLSMCISIILYLYNRDPELLNERYKMQGSGGQKKQDIILTAFIVIGFIGWFILLPLDAQRFHWSPPFPDWIKLVGLAGLFNSWYLFFRAFKDNTFLSPLVRIQAERKQKVITTGVYGFVRHPMYLGAICMFIFAPLLLGSITALFCTTLIIIILAIRTITEEKLLLDELDGYDDYKKKVKFRFFPGIW